ncbi:TPA: type VI secretion system Vgr family protein [Klebsiella pneumoniae]|nr:type VI secretion system tip protein VgrG [Klebsiella pneumoniae]HBS7135283.1 type VI secretion system tip protein VgrG [Klebsiella pneumoniae]HEB5182972.1 type VI secretion system tip protein VgrG [Klebsiella pneumoniae]
MKSLLFSHNHHLLSVKGCEAGLDVLAFEGDEALSQPFRYRIEFTSADHAISKEMMLMKAASLTLQAPVAQGFGINVQQPVRVIQGVVTGFERLSTSRDETHYALTLQPRLALLNRSHQNAIYQDQSVPQIVEKILRERHGLRGQDFLFSLTKTYPRREQVMQYGEDDLRFITRLLGEVGIWFRFTADFAVEFAGIPDSPDVGYRPEPGARPVMAGTLPARVTSTRENDTYGHIDKHGRYRVNMLFDRARWETGFESLWVRQSRPYAGDTYGLHLPLLAGTEVAIGFEDGNPDRPYIAGVLHDSAHGDHVTIRNDKRNVLRTPANNKIRLDDERGKEHIKVSTEYGGKSQLNLGHLVDAEKRPRGEGFELRTDSWGAIRAQKGIFISADGQAQARGQVLDMEPAVSLLKGALNQITEWGRITQIHHNFSPDADSLREFVNGASNLKEAALLMVAPKGVASVTPDTALMHSGKGLYLQSLGEVNIATAQRHSVNASKAISLLSQQEGIRLVSAKGPLEVESHADTLSLTSLKDVTVQSTQGHLQLTAKNGITIACGGAYIQLTPEGEIKVHGPGLLSLKGQHNMEGPASQDFPLPELPSSVCKDCLKRAQEIAQGFVPREV